MSTKLAGEALSRPEIRLRSGDMEANISLQGGFINGLWLNRAHGRQNLLLPRQEFQTPEGIKARGGNHVCLPLFGPSEQLNQHGFGRDLPWKLLNQKDNSVSMVLQVDGTEPVKGAELYAGLFAQMEISLFDQGYPEPKLELMLIVDNQGQDPILVAPGFHPYFAVPQGWTTSEIASETTVAALDDRGYSPIDLSEEELLKAKKIPTQDGRVFLETCNRDIEIVSENLPEYVAWSGLEAPYVCLEPTASGPLDDKKPEDAILVPSQTKTYRTTMIWHQI